MSNTATAPRRGRRPKVIHVRKSATLAAAPSLNAIESNVAYTKRQFLAATGLGLKSLRASMRDGLPVKKIGRGYYILGNDWLAFLASRPSVVGAGTAAAKSPRTN